MTMLRYTVPVSVADLERLTGNYQVNFVVPSGETWEILVIGSQYVSSATDGTRLITVDITINGNRCLRLRSITQTANNSYEHFFGRGSPNDSAATSGIVLRNLPSGLELKAGDSVRVFDANGVDTTGDRQTAYIILRRRKT